MTSRRIVVLNGHPRRTSLAGHLADVYTQAARAAGHELRQLRLADMAFDPDHDTGGYASSKPLEPVLAGFLDDLEWCDHLVIASPMWWGTVPAKLKGLFDRALIPGRTFSTRKTTRLGLPAPMLTGRSARAIITSDSPRSYLRLAHGDAMVRQLKGQVLGFVGFRPVRISYCAPASHPGQGMLTKWEARLKAAANRGA